MIKDVQHVEVDYDKQRYAGHPRQGGIFDFGDGEIAVLYNRAPSAYTEWADVRHDWGGYHMRSQVILARSLDSGATWDREHDVVVFDQTTPEAERLAFIEQATKDPDIKRDKIDLNAPDSAIFFGRTWIGDTDPARTVTFALRSADRGRTWESVPTPLIPRSAGASVHKDAHPLVAMPDGTHLGAMSHSGSDMIRGKDDANLAGMTYRGHVSLYGSDDHGLTWEPIATICDDPTGAGRATYAGLLLLPSGRLQCYALNIGGLRDAIQVCHSDDGGYSWSDTRPIVRWGHSPWVTRPSNPSITGHGAFGKFYRSPWPLRMADGRIVVLFGRRKPPYGMGLILSEDDGETWSDEQIVRDDASGPDLAYPVAVETEPGHIFAAYYYMLDDGNGFGGTRFIAGTHLRI